MSKLIYVIWDALHPYDKLWTWFLKLESMFVVLALFAGLTATAVEVNLKTTMKMFD